MVRCCRRLPWPMLVSVMTLLLFLGTAGAAKTVLTVAPWSSMGDRNQGGMMEQLVAEYEKLRPDIEIEIITQIPTYEFIVRLMLMPQMADVQETHLGWFPELMQAGVPSPLPPQLDHKVKNFFFQPVLQPISHGGRLYAVPTEYQLYALGYNTRIWAEAGMATVPKTWEELRQVAMKGTTRNPDGSIGRTGLRFSGIDWAAGGEGETHTFLSFLWSNNGVYIDESGRPGFDGIEALETLTFLTDMVRGEMAQASGWSGLHNGDAFMAIIPAWSRNTLRNAMPDGFTIQSALIPHGRGGHATVQYGWAYIVPSKAKNPDEAWEFLDWLTMRTDGGQMTRSGKAMEVLGSVPTNAHDLRLRREMQTEHFWKGLLDGMNLARPEPHYPQILTRWKEMGAFLGPALRLQVPPAQGLADAQIKLTNMLASSLKQ